MLVKLYQIVLYFLLATQPASRSLSTDLYFRIPDTGQPVLIQLVDTAAAELSNVIANNLDSENLSSNSNKVNATDTSSRGYNASPIVVDSLNVTQDVKSVEGNESQKAIREEVIVRAIPQEKEDTRTVDKTKDSEFPVNDTAEATNVVNNDTVAQSTEDEASKEKAKLQSSQSQEEIPSFAEWAQKQLEEAEKNKENVVNHSTQSIKGNSGSITNMKVRSKNYASPDCGAKIVAANPEAGSAGYILTPNKDEYMLNTCNSRIWFVVELCEAIQAKKVDMANFELFSSTPKNFSVFVSDRFPSREWASVGQFIAKDEKDVQTFNLHPHLFGKFVKVEMHSHYGDEHYCPISLFRVYGTSEFEVFETENSPHSQSSQPADDDDDILEDLQNTTEKEDQTRNLFGSARDAVLSIVKKAAQVLVKSSDAKNVTQLIEIEAPKSNNCKTPSHIIVCDNCSNSMFSDVFNLMSCNSDDINRFVQSPIVRDTLTNTDVCQIYGLDFKSRRTSLVSPKMSTYITTLLFPSYIAALCNMLAIIEKKVVLNSSYEADLNVTTNLTIDKKVQSAADKGNIDELLQKPFATCADPSDPYCSSNSDSEQMETKPIKVEPEGLPGDHSGIKPTKTIQKDMDSKQPVITVTGTVPLKISSSEQEVNAIDSTHIEGSKDASVSINVDNTAHETKNESSIDPNAKVEDKPNVSTANQGVSNNSVDNAEIKNGSTDAADESKIFVQDQISLDNLLKELEQASTDGNQNQMSTGNMPSSQGQKESVFLRLSNRIKALERNMSLSGQYLEELSRRYKKQMEEMQKTFEKTLSAMSEEAKNAEERHNRNAEEMTKLQNQLGELTSSVSALVSERESILGTLSLTKIIITQIIITFLIIYFIKKYTAQPTPVVNERKISGTRNNYNYNKNVKTRRKSAEVPVNSEHCDVKIRKRRPSEEALHITRTASDMRENYLKVEKKKRKRKSPIIQRSYSIATPPGSVKPIKLENDWSPLDLSKNSLNAPIVLDEPEFIIPELDPMDFHHPGDEMKESGGNGVAVVKREFPKTNGSIFGRKTPDKKTEKSRRLSSPAFFKSALIRSSVNKNASSNSTPTMRRSVSPITEKSDKLPLQREVKSEERRVERESPQLSICSSNGNMSDTSGSTRTDFESLKKKNSKRSLKNIFKKVF